MKRKILILLFLLNSFPMKANTQTQILIDDPAMKYFIIVTIFSDNKHIQTITIDKNIIIPITCLNNEITKINSFNYTNSYNCLISSINQSYHTNISRYVQLNHKNINNDFQINTKEITNGKDFIQKSSALMNKLSFTTILNYKKYLTTNYSITDLYDLFQLYLQRTSKTQITHDTVSYIIIKDGYLPLNRNFDKENTAY